MKLCAKLLTTKPSGMREAIRRPSRDGVLNSRFEVLPSPSKANLPKPRFSESERLSSPSLILPRRPAHSARPTNFFPGFAFLPPLELKKWRSKRPSKNDQILMPFQHRFWSVLAPFWRAKMAPKSIKNRSKWGFRAFLFPHRFLHRFLIDFCSQLQPAGSPQSMFFLRENHVFKKHAFRR